MTETQFTFQRVEKKYLLTPEKYVRFRQALGERVQEDRFGLHTIQNLYLDTPDYAMIRLSLAHPIYKEKLRLRSYGTPGDQDAVFAEIKKKYKGVVYKRRMALSAGEVPCLMDGKALPNHEEQVQREFLRLMRMWRPEPRVFIGYDRVACVGTEDPVLRITFDRRLRWRTKGLDLRLGDGGEPVLPRELIIAEIKFPQAAPLWLADILCQLEIRPASFSKYGACYQRWLVRPAEGWIHHA